MTFSVTAPSPRTKLISGLIVGLYALVTLAPLLWIIATGFKSGQDSIHYPPKILFEPTRVRQSIYYPNKDPVRSSTKRHDIDDMV